QLGYPPFSRLARLVYAHTSLETCQNKAEKMRDLLTGERESRGLADISLIGPAPAFVPRLYGKYRWQLIVRAYNPADFLAGIDFPRGWGIDIDPVGLV
ncbi:MAG TPA: primosomal protein N', partial [Dehalococcoidales bacterium]|nr:primosomal protein N' [Dehalococcoidales bacterium]